MARPRYAIQRAVLQDPLEVTDRLLVEWKGYFFYRSSGTSANEQTFPGAFFELYGITTATRRADGPEATDDELAIMIRDDNCTKLWDYFFLAKDGGRSEVAEWAADLLERAGQGEGSDRQRYFLRRFYDEDVALTSALIDPDAFKAAAGPEVYRALAGRKRRAAKPRGAVDVLYSPAHVNRWMEESGELSSVITAWMRNADLVEAVEGSARRCGALLGVGPDAVQGVAEELASH